MSGPRIALIHALRLSVAPIVDAFERLWPEAERLNLLDDSLSADRARDGRLTEQMVDRFLTLGRYAVAQGGADAILFTCSAFGPAIDAVASALPVPVMKPNSAMIARAVAGGGQIGLLATFAPTIDSMLDEFPAEARVTPRLIPDALAAADRDDGAEHDRLAVATAREMIECEVLALAQFSLARAAGAIAAATGKPVLTTPDCAVDAMRALFVGGAEERTGRG